MRWTVTWLPIAESELATLWTDASDRSAVSKAAHAFDRFIPSDPLHLGESREGDQRIVFVGSIGFLYRVVVDD